MKCLSRNRQKFFYALYAGKEAMLDEYGNKSGEYRLAYTDPVAAYANISAVSGETETQQFGENVDYDKVIVFEKGVLPIDEYTILWVDSEPVSGEDTPHDYVVRKVATSLNSVSVAISKVTVRG